MEKKLQPKLRFKEFSGELKHINLEKVVKINPKAKELPNEFVYIDLESVESGVLKKENKILKEEAPSRAQRVLNKNDILYQTVRPYQKNNLFFDKDSNNYVASTGYAQLRTKESASFIYQLLHTENFVNKVMVRCTGTSYPAINSTDLKTIKINIPPLPEQEKIASFLSSVDSKIEKLEKKKELLDQYKKGAMQEIFNPIKNDELGIKNFRFKRDDGTEYPAWEEKKLGEVATFINGRAYKQKELLEKGKYPVLRVGNFFTNNSWYYSDLELDQNKYCDNGDLLYAWSASFGPRIWKGDKVIYHYHIWKVLSSEQILKNYLFTILNYETEIIKTRASNGFGLLHITKGAIENWGIKLPCLEEQEKIANFLSSIDKKIDIVGTEIEKNKEFKKGLLQQLFV